MKPQTTQNLIIGAGPAGLAVAGRMRKLDIPFEILEKTEHVASAWHQHYDRLHLHTVKQLSALPHLPFPEKYPTYVSKNALLTYFENYVKGFDIEPIFNSEVSQIKKEGENWLVNTVGGKAFLANNVIISTGVNRTPNVPVWEGQEHFQGNIIHSRYYKNPDAYKGKKVLVVGMGNTGAEVALDFAEHNIDVSISVRNPITIVPRDVNGRPVQLTAKTLAKIPFGIGDWLGTQIRKFIIGDLTKYGVPLSKVHPTVQLRETGKTPVVDIGTAQAIKERKIKVVSEIIRFTENGVICKKGEELQVDEVVLATGYRPDLFDFIEGVEDFLDRYQCPKAPIGTGELQNMYFVGFDNYKLGGVLGTIFTDSETVVNAIGKNTLSSTQI